MNKQLTKITIGIAASAALMASVAFSGSALAGGKGKGKGPQASAAVSAWCEITDEAAGEMTVHVLVEDKSGGEAFGSVKVETATVQGLTKSGGRYWDDIPGALATPDLMVDAGYQPVTIDICRGDDLGKAINAETTIVLNEDKYPSNKAEYTSKCGDNPYTIDVIEGGLKTAEYPNLCSL